MIVADSAYSAGPAERTIGDLLRDRPPRSAEMIGLFIAATGEASGDECE